MTFLPVRERYLAPAALESQLQIWEIFPNSGLRKNALEKGGQQPRKAGKT
jgi:hypothetical protein